MKNTKEPKILFQFPFFNLQEERLANLDIQTAYASRQLLGDFDRKIFESTKDGTSTIPKLNMNGFEVVQYQEDTFSIQRSRNEAIKYAIKYEFDFVVIIDADVLIEGNSIRQCIEFLQHSKTPIQYPYNGHIHNIPREMVQNFPPYDSISREGLQDMNYLGKAPGGCVILRVKSLTHKDLYPEEFIGWGCEDTLFADIMCHRYGPIHRVDFPYLHLSHQRTGSHYSYKTMVDNEMKYRKYMQDNNIKKRTQVMIPFIGQAIR